MGEKMCEIELQLIGSRDILCHRYMAWQKTNKCQAQLLVGITALVSSVWQSKF